MDKRKATRSGPHATNGLVIWRARRRHGVTQEELAQVAGVSRIQIIKLENGMHLPRPDTRDRMEKFFGLAPETIKCEEAAPARDPFRGSRRETPPDRPGRSRGSSGKARQVKKAA